MKEVETELSDEQNRVPQDSAENTSSIGSGSEETMEMESEAVPEIESAQTDSKETSTFEDLTLNYKNQNLDMMDDKNEHSTSKSIEISETVTND